MNWEKRLNLNTCQVKFAIRILATLATLQQHCHRVILVAPSSISVASSACVKDQKFPRLSLGTNAAPPKRDVGLASLVLAWR